MKIAILTNILNPYRKAFFHELNRQLTEAGDSLKVFVMSATEYDRQWKYEEYSEDYAVLLKCKSFRVRNLPLYFNQDLKKRLSDYKPDILVMSGGYMLPSNWKALRFQKELKYKKLFWSESHLDQQSGYSSITIKVREWIRKHFYRKMDGFWYPGEKALELIRKYSKDNPELYCIPNLIENTKFVSCAGQMSGIDVREKYDLDRQRTIWFAPMRLHWNKGLIPFMEMFSEVKGNENIQLVVAGEGEAENEIRDTAKRLGIDLRLVGYQQEKETIDLYHAADAFFLPSVSDPSPLTCIEALWCGLPLLLSEHVGNATETVVQGENGYVFSYHNREDGIKTIQTFVDQSPEWKAQARTRSLELANERFDLNKVTARLLSEMRKNRPED